VRTQQTVLRIVDHGIFADLGKVAAYQGKVVIAIGLTDLSYPLESGFIADVTAERVARIRGVDDDAAGAQHLDRLAYEAPLRRDRMQLQIDAHRKSVIMGA
jgi:hypothetical protein